MNDRVRQLRDASLQATPTLSTERAGIVTRVYREAGLLSAPMLRARVFAAIMAEKSIYIHPGELIVGERGPAPKATSTFPEICCHSLADLEILDRREKVFFKVDDATRQQYRDEFIPFWQGKTLREKILASMSEEWQEAYAAGIFTEFMEQRGPGHTVLDDKIYQRGMNDFIALIDARLAGLDYVEDPAAYDQAEELRAMRLCAQSIIHLALRHAEMAEALAAGESDPQRRAELLQIAAVCRRVPAEKPRTFHEALQYYWFVHLGVITEINPWDAFNPGRLDQHLYPFYQRELAAGTLTREAARELLHCFWVKFNNQPAPPKVGVTAAESSTYTDFANINSGGLRADGSDGVNELSYLILEVIDEMRLVQPSSNIQLSRKNPDAFLKQALRVVRKGWGQPSLFNADTVVDELLRQGKSVEDARQGGTSGCVETGAFGKEAYILTGYFNIPKILELTLHDGFDPRTGHQLGPHTGDPASWSSFADLMAAFEQQMAHFIAIKLAGNAIIERLYALYLPVPFLSILIDDCIARGKDYNAGGARYNTSYIQGVGIGTISDSLAALKYHVFEQQNFTLPGFIAMLERDFAGDEAARLRLLNQTPKYGNDEAYADDLMRQVFELYYALINGRPNTRGGTYRINLLPTTCHVYFGSVIGATPDGRKAGTPLSEGISPVQGADRKGPTAVLKSAAKMDHVRTGGTLLNQKFTPQLLSDEAGLNGLVQLIRTYFRLEGHHIQFNVVDVDTLRAAQRDPQQYRDLIVRVAGYSDYFCDLSETLQNEIIARTEHQDF